MIHQQSAKIFASARRLLRKKKLKSGINIKWFKEKEGEMKFMDHKGVTLLELVATVVVLGTVAPMAASEFGDVLKKLKFKGRSRDVVSDMRLARSEAIAQRTQLRLHFDYSGNEYVLFKDLVNLAQFSYDQGDSVIKTFSLGKRCVDIQSHFLFYNNYEYGTIVFNPDVSASLSGYLVLSDRQWKNQSEIDVLASTGLVKLTYSYRDD
jgi:Tfp pilus assembly protein FimT